MSSLYGLSKNDLSNKVFFDLPPNPVPLIIPKRLGSVEQTIPESNSGVISPGHSVFFDMGYAASYGTLDIQLVKVVQATYASLLALYQNVSTVFYTPNNFVNYWECVWSSGKSFDLEYIKGTPFYEGKLLLEILRQVA